MTALSIIIDIVLILISIALIVAVLMQEGQRQGLGAIGGGAETFFGKNKAKSMEGRLQRYTKIAAAIFIVLAIVATIITSHKATKNRIEGLKGSFLYSVISSAHRIPMPKTTRHSLPPIEDQILKDGE